MIRVSLLFCVGPLVSCFLDSGDYSEEVGLIFFVVYVMILSNESQVAFLFLFVFYVAPDFDSMFVFKVRLMLCLKDELHLLY